MKLKKIVKKVYAQYGVNVHLKTIHLKTKYCQYFEIEVLPGTKVDDIFKHSKNVQAVLKLPTFIPFISGKYMVLLISCMDAMPNNFLDLYHSKYFHCNDYRLPIAMGYDLFFRPVINDLDEMVHILCAGITNSGKSTFLICLILSLIMKCSVQMVNILIFDVGATSLSNFKDIPHLSHPIVKDERTGIYVLNALVNEMEQRIQLNSDELQEKPAIVCVIDEFTSLMSNLCDKKISDEYKKAIDNLLRRGRKAKIHMILATQNPSSEEMKIDKGNASTRVAFKLSSQQTSHCFIGEIGAESLPGRGALFLRDGTSATPIRMQGAYISEEDTLKMISCVKDSNQDTSNIFRIPQFNHSETILNNAMLHMEHQTSKNDSEFATIALWCLGNSEVSSLKIQKTFGIGNRAYAMLDKLTEMKIVSEKHGKLPRKVLPKSLEELSKEARMFFKVNNIEDNEIIEAIAKLS